MQHIVYQQIKNIIFLIKLEYFYFAQKNCKFAS